MTSDPLTPKSYWDERHHHIDLKKIYPDPRFYFLDFELDRVFQKHLSGMAGKKLVEMGCGSSVWLPYFKKEYGLDISGIDYSEEGIETCSEILRRNGIKGQLFKENIFELADGSKHQYDVVFSLGFIEHFRNPIHVLRIFNEYLASPGLIITWVPNTSGIAIKISSLMNKKAKSIYCSLDLKKLISLHHSAELHIVESRYTQFLDLSLINLLKLPMFWQRCFSRGFRLLTLPFIYLEKYLKIHIKSKILSSGMLVVAKKTSAKNEGTS